MHTNVQRDAFLFVLPCMEMEGQEKAARSVTWHANESKN